MNRVHRLVWNRSLHAVQAAPENARAQGGAAGRFTARALRRHPLALAVATFALASSAPAWSQICSPTSPTGCSAPGGIGDRPTRSPNGGAGNGTGGNSVVWNPDTTISAGAAGSDGNGGQGADGVFDVESINVTATGGNGGGVGATGSAGVTSSVTGQIGGTGEPASGQSIVGGGGGGGGAGVFINDSDSTPTVANSTTIRGGAGGQGGDALASPDNGNATNGDPGGGGGGGAGVIVGAGTVSMLNNGALTGGAGGAGGNGGYAGGGGGGGDGLLVLGAGADITNNVTGTITGGAGGAPGTFQDGSNERGGYGGGGAGVNLVGSGDQLNNSGAIFGGSAQGDGAAGVGLRAWGSANVSTSGAIKGGINGTGVQADAVLFSGGANQLRINGGASFSGGIVSTSGTTNGGDDLILGGNVDGTLNAGQIVGFLNNVKAGNSMWTLTGSGNAGINWTIEQGQLLGNANAFAGSLVFAATGLGTEPSVDFVQTSNGNFAGSVSGTGTLVKDGAGTLQLAGDLSSFAGPFEIEGGNVSITGIGNLSNTELTGLVQTTFDVSNITGTSATLAGLSGIGDVTLGAHTLILNNPNNDSFGGAISGTGGLTLSAGTETFSGHNAYTGDTTVNAGTLTLMGDAQIGEGASRAVVNGTLDLSGLNTGETLALSSLGGTGSVVLGGSTLMLQNALDTFDGVISGAGALTIAQGTQTLTGLNTYTGTTEVNTGGTLKLTGNGKISNQSLANVNGTLDISGLAAGSTLVLRGLDGAGSITLGANNLAFAAGSGAFDGVIEGTGGVTLDSGTQTLFGHNAYSGDTVINGGTLVLAPGGTISASSVQMSGGTFSVSGLGAGSSLSVVSLGGGAGNVNLGSTGLTLSNAADTYGGVIGGTGTLTVDAGREVLNGINTYAGLTTVASGATLVVGDGTHTTAQIGGDVSVDGGTLGGFGVVSGSASISNGGTLAAGDVGAIGTLTVNGNLTVNDGSQLAFDFGAPGPNFATPGQSDHVVVNGDLAIGSSTLNVNNLGSMGPGLYNLFQWGGSLDITGGGFAPPSGMSLQILTTDRQINLIDTQNVTLDEWDANGLAGPGSMGGGSGTWSLFSNTWSDTTGQSVGPMAPQPAFAIFGGAFGDVTVDDSSGAVSATGLQFMSDGYRLTGAALTLVGQSGVAPVVRVSSGDTAIIDNVIDGVDGLNKTDGGTLVLTGTNLYQGTTTLSGGYLSVASDANLGGSADPLEFQGGTLKITGTSFNQTSRNIVWGNAGGGFDIDDAANTFTVAQALTGSGGLLKTGAGTLLLNGGNTYSGDTLVDAGTLQVGDAAHSGASVGGNLEVAAGGTLRGHGTVMGSLANSGGTVAPGGSIGTLSVGGNYNQASNGTLAIEVSPTAASQLNIAGTATLNGTLALTYDPGTYTAKQYTLLAANQGLSGSFASVAKTVSAGANLGSLQQSVSYSANAVELALAEPQTGPTGPSGPSGPSGPIGPTGPTPPVVIAPTGISIYTALGSSVSMGAQAANATLLGRMGRLSAATATGPDTSATRDGWIDASGAQTHVGGANGEPGYQANRYGFLAGLDRPLGDYTLGIAGGYSHTDLSEQSTGDSGTADTLRVALYGNRWLGPVGVSATAGYGLDFLSQKRPFGPTGTAEGDHLGHELTAAGQASLPLTLGSLVVTPRVGLRYVYFHANGFGESGAGGQDLGVGTDNVHSLQPYAEVTVDKAFGDALRPVDVQLRLGYAHELLDANRAMTVAAQDGTLFAAPGTSLPRGYLTTGVSVSMRPTRAMTVSIGYDALINTTHASAQAANLKLGYQF